MTKFLPKIYFFKKNLATKLWQGKQIIEIILHYFFLLFKVLISASSFSTF